MAKKTKDNSSSKGLIIFTAVAILATIFTITAVNNSNGNNGEIITPSEELTSNYISSEDEITSSDYTSEEIESSENNSIFSEEIILPKVNDVVGGVINQVTEGYIFACAPVENATGYHLQVLDSSNDVVAEQDITNGGQITCTSELPSGTYTIQVKAVGDGVNYSDSNYVVISSSFEIEIDLSGTPYLSFTYTSASTGSDVVIKDANFYSETTNGRYSSIGGFSLTSDFVFYRFDSVLTAGDVVKDLYIKIGNKEIVLHLTVLCRKYKL